MPKPKDLTKAPRLRWSPEEIDRLVREAARLMLDAERAGLPLPRIKAVDLAQQVLLQDRQRQLDSTFNPSWMGSEGRIEAMIEQLRAARPSVVEAPAPEPVPTPAPAAKSAKSAKSAKLREQAALFTEPAPVRARRKKVVEEVLPAQAKASNVADDAAVEVAVPDPVPQPVAASEVPAADAATNMDLAAVSPPEAEPIAKPVAVQEAETPPAATPAVEPPAKAPSDARQEEALSIHMLAGMDVDVLAGALRTVATKALAGLLVDVLRQPEVQAALRDAMGSAPRGKPFKDRHQGEEGRPEWRPREQREWREPMHRQTDTRIPPAPRAPEEPAPAQQHEAPAYRREREPDDEIEPVLLDPNAWQATPLHALPERSARGASDAPRATVAVFGLLPRDQQRLKAEFGQRFKLRFGLSAKTAQALDSVKDVDQIYSMVRFITKDLDRGLAASGVPYTPLQSIGELRHELQVNPPLPREEAL